MLKNLKKDRLFDILEKLTENIPGLMLRKHRSSSNVIPGKYPAFNHLTLNKYFKRLIYEKR
jgi:hypothetical protein